MEPALFAEMSLENVQLGDEFEILSCPPPAFGDAPGDVTLNCRNPKTC
jgi:hypothetical protein